MIFQKKVFYPICLLESSVSWDREGKHVIGWDVTSHSFSLPGMAFYIHNFCGVTLDLAM